MFLYIAATILFTYVVPQLAWARNDKPSHAQTQIAMPAIRRIGVSFPGHNVTELRQFYKNDALQLIGLPGSTLNPEALSELIREQISAALFESGRYWNISLDKVTDFPLDNARKRLEKEYDLDAWLECEIRFFPDSTLVRLWLQSAKSPTNNVVLLGREDVYVEAQIDEEQLKIALASALQRLGSTLAHDGHLTFQAQDIVTLDFGKERGLTQGMHVHAGVILLSKTHPRSGEPLAVRRLTTHDLEIIDVAQGSSLARIKAINEAAFFEAQQYVRQDEKTRKYLAWIPRESKESRLTQVQKSNSKKGDELIIGSLPNGFKALIPKVKIIPKISGSPEAPISASNEPIMAQVTEDTSPDKTSVGNANQSPLSEENTDRQGNMTWENPATWAIHRASAGLGLSLGQLYVPSKNGARNTGISTTVLNFLSASADIEFLPGILAEPALDVEWFEGGDVKGKKFNLDVNIYGPLFKGSGYEILAGGGLGIAMGSATAIYIRPDPYSDDIGEFSALAMSRILLPKTNLGRISITAGIDMLSLVLGEFGARAEFRLSHSSYLPKEIGLFIKLQQGPVHWSQFSLGGDWDFMARENSVK